MSIPTHEEVEEMADDDDYCPRCDAVVKYDGEVCTSCGREWGFE